MWPTAFALKSLAAAEEAKIGALVKKATRRQRSRAARAVSGEPVALW